MDSHDFQDILDIYFKQKLSKSPRVLKISLNRLKKKQKHFITETWPKEKKNLKTFYFAIKAIHIGASSHLPLETLALIGDLAADPYYRPIINQIINDNALSYKSRIWKLDDYQSQDKIQKALKERQITNVQNFVA